MYYVCKADGVHCTELLAKAVSSFKGCERDCKRFPDNLSCFRARTATTSELISQNRSLNENLLSNSSTYYSAHKSSNHSTIMIDNWGLGYGPNENCSLIPGCADHHNDYDSGGDDHCGDSLWSQ